MCHVRAPERGLPRLPGRRRGRAQRRLDAFKHGR
jgi:hypothetical protein